MNRPIANINQLIMEWMFTKPAQDGMVSNAKLAAAVLGTGTLVNGASCGPTSPASLQVQVGAGEIYQLASLEATLMGTLPADTGHVILKQGVNLGATQLICSPPVTVGQSVCYLIQGQYQDQDVSVDPTTGAANVVLPFFNSADPTVPWSGPNNSGATSNTFRNGVFALSAKAGTPATTGTQVAPTADAGWVGLNVVTVANGATTIVSGNIAAAAGAPLLTETLTQKISQATGDARYLQAVNLTASLIETALGFTPVNQAGDTMTGLLTLSGSPTASGHAATKGYVDSTAVGLQPKAAVVAATTGTNITLSGTQTIDSVAVTAGQRVLVKDQTLPQNNGIYVCAAGAWARATDLDAWTEAIGAFCFVSGGTINGNTSWITSVIAGGTIGTTVMPWVAFSSLPTSSSSTPGVVQLATNAEALAGTSTGKAITPQDLAYVITNAILASPAFTGNPTAPTPVSTDNDTSIATTAFVKALTTLLAPLASAALTGTPTAPTPAPGDNSTRLATTAFLAAAFTQSFVTNGYVKLPNGLILQWGTKSFSGTGSRTIATSFPIAFPTACLQVLACDVGLGVYTYAASPISTSQFNLYVPAGQLGSTTTVTGTVSGAATFFAIGY